MPRKKPTATLGVADGAGGMKQLKDRRFEKGRWLEEGAFEGEQADTWLQYLARECDRRGLQCPGITQIEARENSGSYTIRPAGPDPQPELVVAWEREPDGPLVVRSRLAGNPLFDELLARDILNDATAACRAAVKERVFCAGYLMYDGLPWRGEYWLNAELRLGTPPREYQEGLRGPRAILVETIFEGVDITDARAGFRVFMRELSAFLSVALRKRIQAPPVYSPPKRWVWTTDAQLRVECDVRQLGYEVAPPRDAMPDPGIEPAVPTFAVARPDLQARGNIAEDSLSLPSDFDDLWSRFAGLPPDRRAQFLGVASLWQISNALAGEFHTASVAYLVAACEALKPADADQRLNAYDVIEAILGKAQAQRFRSELKPARIRHAHFHAGELRGDEFRKLMIMESYRDPTFQQMHNETWLVTAACIVEWLRLGGVLVMEKRPEANWFERTSRYRIAGVCLVLGMGLGWFLGAKLASAATRAR